MEFTSMREPGNAMLYTVMLFVLPENFRQLKEAATNTSMQRLLGTEQQSALYPHFPQQHNTQMTKGPVLLHCTNICLCLTSPITSWDRGGFLGQNAQHGGSHGLLWGAYRSFTTSHFCCSLVEQGGRETPVCACLGIPTKRTLKPN